LDHVSPPPLPINVGKCRVVSTNREQIISKDREKGELPCCPNFVCSGILAVTLPLEFGPDALAHWSGGGWVELNIAFKGIEHFKPAI